MPTVPGDQVSLYQNFYVNEVKSLISGKNEGTAPKITAIMVNLRTS
jgi:hypothetical protein